MNIPVYILEEHHEAFLAWMLAAKSGIIPNKNNILFHFDDHSDMSVPKLNKSLQEIWSWSEQEIRDFTYTELDIASFILAAGFTGFIRHVSWIQTDMPRVGTSEMYITSYDNNNRNILAGALNEASAPLLQSGYQRLNYERIRPELFHPVKTTDVLLDIDLDYFSCETNPETRNEVVLEVTQEQYEEFLQQQYHPLKFAVHRAEAMAANGRYYLVINYYNAILPSPRKVTPEKIAARMDEFIALLHHKNIRPALITICRSRYSGYTPEDQWELIEQLLLKGLNTLYQTSLVHIYEATDKTMLCKS
ncbi:uncharacterized protein UPF0489 [Chitinophaga dinghuensis]|uniref:Uncharacterized protein UPF0489 n=1 Tax=Chitinophaga dinghuensis TaxID=1539050 RepID=A0A327VJM2_9BACT|nr:UPF0489 family protein [Chitinophaga dinghuensis]RAJ74054.1 uncharacterized protein UPF0489 [Chitinophaga dinghuensis]